MRKVIIFFFGFSTCICLCKAMHLHGIDAFWMTGAVWMMVYFIAFAVDQIKDLDK